MTKHKGIPGTEVIMPDIIEDGHIVHHWNCKLMYCPKDRRLHRFGCACARADIRLVPICLREFYRQAWGKKR